MGQQLGFVQNENGMLFARFVEARDRFRNLRGEIAAEVGRFQIQTASDLP